MQNVDLVLRDIHQPPAPPWWPPAPGWWWLSALVVVGAAVLLWRVWRRHRHRRAIERLFDHTVSIADTPAARIAAISELLRRAARRRHPGADTLIGEDWLRLLDEGLKAPVFAGGIGAVLRDGAFRRDITPQQVDALQRVARERFMDWMASA
jgi:hypothetical protein